MAIKDSSKELDRRLLELLGENSSEAELLTSLDRCIADLPLPAGYRLPSMRKLRELTGLRHHEIYRALGVLAAKGRIVQQRGAGTYVSGADKKTKRSSRDATLRIGVVPPVRSPGASHHAIALILSGISEQADVRHRVEIIPAQISQLSPRPFMDHVQWLNLDGIIWVQPPAVIPPALVSLSDSSLPLVVTGRPYTQLPLPTVSFDNEALGTSIVECMMRHRRSRLFCMVGPRDDLYTENQVNSIRTALKLQELSLPDRNLLTIRLSGAPGFYSIDLTCCIAEYLNKHDDFDAIYTLYPDRLDILTEMHISGRRRCPDDFLHMHFGQMNIAEGQQWPPFPTTVFGLPYQSMGRQAVKELERILGVPGDTEDEDLSPLAAFSPQGA